MTKHSAHIAASIPSNELACSDLTLAPISGAVRPLPRRHQLGWATNVTASAAVVIFLCLFAAQAGLTALSPVLAEIAIDFGVSTAWAGQLRTLAGVVAGATALAMVPLGRRVRLDRMLRTGLAVLLLGTVIGAAAPTLAVLAAAQILMGAGVAMLLGAGMTAASEWAPPEKRARLLSWALIGMASSWIVGMPTIGVLGEASWRYALTVPFVAGLVAVVAVLRGPTSPISASGSGGMRSALRPPGAKGWAVGELLAFSSWGGVLVYAGALLVESHGASLTQAGLALAGLAVAYVPGSLFFRRFAGEQARPLLIGLGLAAAAFAAVLGASPGLWHSAVVLAALGFVGAGRSLAGGVFGLHGDANRRFAIMSLRASITQFGYLFGAAVGGAALVLGGYRLLGLAFGAGFALAVIPHVAALVGEQRRGRAPSMLRALHTPELAADSFRRRLDYCENMLFGSRSSAPPSRHSGEKYSVSSQ